MISAAIPVMNQPTMSPMNMKTAKLWPFRSAYFATRYDGKIHSGTIRISSSSGPTFGIAR